MGVGAGQPTDTAARQQLEEHAVVVPTKRTAETAGEGARKTTNPAEKRPALPNAERSKRKREKKRATVTAAAATAAAQAGEAEEHIDICA